MKRKRKQIIFKFKAPPENVCLLFQKSLEKKRNCKFFEVFYWMIWVFCHQVFFYLIAWDMCKGFCINSRLAWFKLVPRRFASCKSLPDKSARSKSAPASIADLRMQFFKFAPLSDETLRLTQAQLLFSSVAPFKFEPSRLDLTPLGSSKLQFDNIAPSMFAQSPFIPRKKMRR